MPFEAFKPSKESRDIERKQKEQIQKDQSGAMVEIDLGFARNYTETAKIGDTPKGMIKRAYKEAKLYSEEQASLATGQVLERLQSEYTDNEKGKLRVNQGDRITFRNDSITLSTFNRSKGWFEDTKISLANEEGSINYKKPEIFSASTEARASLAATVRREPAAEKKPLEISTNEQQRLEAFRAFLRDTEKLRKLIRKDDQEDVQIVTRTRVDSPFPSQINDYEFGEIIAQRKNGEEKYMIGLKRSTGEVVLFNEATPEKQKRIKNILDTGQISLTLAAIANPDKEK